MGEEDNQAAIARSENVSFAKGLVVKKAQRGEAIEIEVNSGMAFSKSITSKQLTEDFKEERTFIPLESLDL